MKCIFCKENSTETKGVEHIVPESLGNSEHVMPKGTVCDKCNNYFSLKIEKPTLENDFFKELRFRNNIQSKKRKYPKGKGLIPLTNDQPEIHFPKNSNNINITVTQESFELIKSGKIKQLYIPTSSKIPKDIQYVSRFICKIGFEFLALRLCDTSYDWELITSEPIFEPIRQYVRYNQKNENWVYSARKIYSEDERFRLENNETVDMVFECDFLATREREIYFVIAFKGVEFAVNMAGDSIEGYQKWLVENNNISPLYRKGNHFGYKLTPDFIKKKTNPNT